MKNNLKEPCNECPFRKNSIPGWLGGVSVKDTYQGVMHDEENFACHLTRHRPEEEMSRCRGSLLFLRVNCKSPRYNQPLIKAIDEIPLKTVKNCNILNGREFVEHHEKKKKKR